jgi:hypothetical protein
MKHYQTCQSSLCGWFMIGGRLVADVHCTRLASWVDGCFGWKVDAPGCSCCPVFEFEGCFRKDNCYGCRLVVLASVNSTFSCFTSIFADKCDVQLPGSDNIGCSIKSITFIFAKSCLKISQTYGWWSCLHVLRMQCLVEGRVLNPRKRFLSSWFLLLCSSSFLPNPSVSSIA